MPRSCIGSLGAVCDTLLPDEPPANDIAISALDVHNLVSTKEVGNTLNTNQAQLLDVLHALQARHDQLDMKLDTISQSSFTSHPSLRSAASAPRDRTPDHDSYWTDESLEDDRPLLQRHYWDAAMLCQWTDGRDRINKWMLHSLGVDVKQAAVHQQAIEAELSRQGLSVDEVLIAGGSWERLAFQYWLIDEAALGVNMLHP
nr:hypothetical protein B0A51_03790 [Rachicladosporium sp. CCFEE 5018]